MFDYVKSLFDVFASIWLIVDMVLDGLTTWEFYMAAAMASEEQAQYRYLLGDDSHPNPFSPSFAYFKNGTINVEATFFYASLAAILLPVPMGILIIAFYYSFKSLYYLNSKHIALAAIFGVFSLVPGILALLLAVLVMPVVWVVSPFIHFAQVMFALFGVKPVGGRSTKVKGDQFTRFWLFVMFLKLIEQFFEALPQVVINGLYIYRYQDKFSENAFYFKNISLVFSVGSVFLFLALNIFKCTFDYENSLFGLIHHTGQEEDKPPPYSEHGELHGPLEVPLRNQLSSQKTENTEGLLMQSGEEGNSVAAGTDHTQAIQVPPSRCCLLLMALEAEKDEYHEDIC